MKYNVARSSDGQRAGQFNRRALGGKPTTWIALFGLVAAGLCPASPPQLDPQALSDAEHTWASSQVHSYRFKVNYASFIPPCLPSRGLRFKVVRDAPANRRHHCVEFEEEFGTVPRMFAFLERAMAANPESIRVEFDPTYGYPRQVDIDWSGMFDDGEFFAIVGFRASRSGL